MGGEKPPRMGFWLRLMGITPAWAGKSKYNQLTRGHFQDHPRVGGEKDVLHFLYTIGLGSPPRGRGKAPCPKCGCPLIRITPAWAGKSKLILEVGEDLRDHPRVGGEKPISILLTLSRSGSPPRGRGKVFRENVVGNPLGITPAWAGKSRRPCGKHGGTEDHPRVGGEKRKRRAASSISWGSPPRGRGKD